MATSKNRASGTSLSNLVAQVVESTANPVPAPAKTKSYPRLGVATGSITWLVTASPKRGASAVRAAAYWGAATVESYLAAGGTKADLAWDFSRGFLTVA